MQMILTCLDRILTLRDELLSESQDSRMYCKIFVEFRSKFYYDPKTGAMRENPFVNSGKNPDEVSYAGDNFIRYTGDTISMAQTQLFAWEAYDKGVKCIYKQSLQN